MRPVRAITAEEEHFRIEPDPILKAGIVRRDPVEPEPVGTLVLMPFRIVEYTPDCDGSLMAQFVAIDSEGMETGWGMEDVPLIPDIALVVTVEELGALFRGEERL